MDIPNETSPFQLTSHFHPQSLLQGHSKLESNFCYERVVFDDVLRIPEQNGTCPPFWMSSMTILRVAPQRPSAYDARVGEN